MKLDYARSRNAREKAGGNSCEETARNFVPETKRTDFLVNKRGKRGREKRGSVIPEREGFSLSYFSLTFFRVFDVTL